MNNAYYIIDEHLIIFSSSQFPKQQQTRPLLSPILFIIIIIISFLFTILVSISIYNKKKFKKINDPKKFTIINQKPYSLFLEILNSNPPLILNSEEVSSNNNGGDNVVELVEGDCCGKSGGKKKKKRSKKIRKDSSSDNSNNNMSGVLEKSCVYPFTNSSSATQRKIKQQYDQLVKSNVSKGLTITQVGEFVNCLVEARNVLQQKSEIIQRKFTITKALLLKADRSSFDRLSQQLYKLEAEQKRLEEDANVYNRLQQQLKLSPAYKKMLEIGARMELKASSDQLADKEDTELPDISFEELLAREKKDTFWQKNGKMRSCMNS